MRLRTIVGRRFQWCSRIARKRRRMSIESAQHELLVGRDDPEVLVPSPQPRVDPLDAPLKGPPSQSRRELADLLHRSALGAL
jgi:hypothetical protein